MVEALSEHNLVMTAIKRDLQHDIVSTASDSNDKAAENNKQILEQLSGVGQQMATLGGKVESLTGQVHFMQQVLSQHLAVAAAGNAAAAAAAAGGGPTAIGKAAAAAVTWDWRRDRMPHCYKHRCVSEHSERLDD